jgi:uncharacterized protein (DUF1015 family)
VSILKPFRAWRPLPNIAHLVACRPYDVMNRAEAKTEAMGNDLSFLHIIRAEIDLPDQVGDYDPQVYDKARQNFDALVQGGNMVQDQQPCLYIYEQEWQGHAQMGIMALISTDDYVQDIIKKHEYTRPAKEQDRINHITRTHLHAEPILTSYKNVPEIDHIVTTVTQQQPDYNFIANDGIRHTFWVMNQSNYIAQIEQLFAQKVPAIYIADGHHRAASSAKVALAMRQQNPQHKGDEAYNFILAVAFPDNQLQIIDYNRVVKDLNGMTTDEFLAKVAEKFTLIPQKSTYKPTAPRHFGIYIGGNWYEALAQQQLYSEHPIDSLDVAILSNHVLAPILGIHDQRTDPRIDFVGGMRGMAELERRVDSGEMALAIAIYPVSMSQLLRVADSGEVMPPKSTWFEPKLRSGLAVHEF